MSLSKLGPHVMNATEAALSWTAVAPIVKSLSRPDPFYLAPDGAIRIFRHYFDQQYRDASRAEEVVQAILNDLGGYRHPNLYVELYNEIYQRQDQGLADLADLTENATSLLHSYGIKVAGFSFSTGQPEIGDWLYLKGRAVPFCGVDAIAIHEYWGNQGFSTWNALRYRRVHDALGGDHPPFVITECGRDAVEDGLGGWKRDAVGASVFFDELVAYDAEIARDDYVLGATPFTAGSTPDWWAFDTDELVPMIVGATAPPPPVPAPTPCAGGQVRQADGSCACPTGQVWQGNRCVTPSSCPSGWIRQPDGSCRQPSCPPGTTRQADGRCTAIPISACYDQFGNRVPCEPVAESVPPWLLAGVILVGVGAVAYITSQKPSWAAA